MLKRRRLFFRIVIHSKFPFLAPKPGHPQAFMVSGTSISQTEGRTGGRVGWGAATTFVVFA
jgi:hypothetical protein